MRLHMVAVGRLRAGPERELVADYVRRTGRTGRPIGLPSLAEIEVDERKGGSKSAEATLLRNALPRGATVVALDERGKMLSSPEFARRIGDWRDAGHQDVAFVIGGANGLDPDFVQSADLSLSFGKMVWPHMLVRVMLSEQIYRAVSILAKTPYHRA